jgi:hypothetical protein
MTTTPTEPGIYRGLPFDVYQDIDVSPKAYMDAKVSPSISSPAMVLGSAVHAMVLEPDTFEDTYAIYDGKVRKGKAWDSFSADNDGKEILTGAEFDTASRVSLSVLGQTVTAGIFRETEKELSLIWIDETTGLKCKARIDSLGQYLVDLKTTSADTPQAFMSAAAKYFYHSQMAFYARGADALGLAYDGVKIVAAQTKGLYESFVVNVPEQTLLDGGEFIDKWLQMVVECEEAGEYKGVGEEEYDFYLPEWCKADVEEVVLTVNGMEVRL